MRRVLLPVLVALLTILSVPAFAARELHVVGIHVGIDNGTEAKVTVDRAGQSVTLFLSCYNPVHWHVNVAAGTTLERVFLQSYHIQSLDGIPAGVPVVRGSYEEGTAYLYVGYSLDSSRFLRSIPRINAMTGQEIDSFHGGYHAPSEPILINTVQDDPRLSFSYPEPVPPDQLPDLRYQLAMYRGGPVELREFTLSEEGGLAALKNGMRVSGDAAKLIYYGGDDGLTAVDSRTGQSQHIPLPEVFAREGWQMGTAFDTLRNRGLVVTLAGEGFVYAYSPATAQWSTAFSMQNRDFDCLEYHPASDTLYGVTLSYDDSVYSKLVGLKAADGSVAKEIPLPIFPFDIDPSSHRAEVVSAGEYLVLLIQPRSNFYSGNGSIPESRIYLVDPRTGELRLTYRSTLPPNQPPKVQIVSPTPGQGVIAGSAVRISATATDTDGTIQSVEFFIDGVSVGFGSPEGGSKYHFDWTVPASGEHTISAQAKDNRGALGVSQPVVVKVNQAPTVRLVEPEDGSSLRLQAPVTLKAVATDPNDAIAAVHFIVDGLPIGPARKIDGTDEYVARWMPSTSGGHTIQARASDSLGAVVFSGVITVHVVAPPFVLVITSPADGSSFVQFSRVELVAAASGELRSVEFFVDGVSIGNAHRLRGILSLGLTWVARGVGEHEITARATLRSGATANSEPISITVTSEGGTAQRLLPAQYRPGRSLRVGILVTPGRGAGSFTITETPPTGWAISNISHGGTYDGVTGKITFGPTAADHVELLTYSATPPGGTKGSKTFSGTLDVDGAVTAITGQQTINGPNAKRPVLLWKTGVD
jgi:hypothetical protein